MAHFSAANKLFVILFLSLLQFIPACQRSPKNGTLLVESVTEGSYEIYSIAGDASLQFVSEHMGHFNQQLSLSPGSYLILADCSHQNIIIHPGEQVKLMAHEVEFVPPHPPAPEDLFSIQCSRYEKSQLKQQIKNRFSFHMISNREDLLVSMQPLRVEFAEATGQRELLTKPKKLSFKLSALQVAAWGEGLPEQSPPFFVSPDKNLLSITQPQSFGRWQFLLPGSYKVEVNGTGMTVDLKESEARIIKPAGFKVQTNPDVDLSLYQQIRGRPINVEINSHHIFDINAFYPVLPGPGKLRFDGSGRIHDVEFVENKVTSQHMNSVLIDLGCAPWEWECLGKTEVNVYLPNDHYPFLESISDVPILYKDKVIQVGLEGSKGIRFKVPENRKNTILHVGKLKIVPRPIFKTGYLTDLVRLESGDPSVTGFSHDILPDRITTMPLIAGQYQLVRYTNQQQENDRVATKFSVRIDAGEISTIEIPYYLPETRARFLARIIRQKLMKLDKQRAYLDRHGRLLNLF